MDMSIPPHTPTLQMLLAEVAQLRTENAKLHQLSQLTLLEDTHDLVQGVGPDGRFVYVNNVWVHTLGYTPQEAADLTVWEIIHPEEHSYCYALWQQLKAGQAFRAVQTRFVGRGGRVVHVQGNASPFTIPGTETVLTYGFFQDTTAARQAETRTQSYLNQLDSLNKLGQLVTSSLNLAEVLQRVLDKVTQLVQAEGVAVLMLEEQELVFKAISGPGTKGLLHMRMPAHEGVAGQVVRTAESIHMVSRESSAVPIYDKVEEVSGFITRSMLAVPILLDQEVIGVLEAANSHNIPFDVDALPLLESASHWAAIAIRNAMLYEKQKEQYQQLQQSQAQLVQAEKMAALGRLAASIAHEINNPIQAIQGCITLTTEELHGAQNPQELDTYLNIVQIELLRVAEIVRRMRDFYRPASPLFEPTDMTVVLDGVFSLLRWQMAQQQINLHWSPPTAVPLIPANANQLKQVFLNLVLNAIDAMPAGGNLHVTLETVTIMEGQAHPPQSILRLTLQDSGVGMSPEVLARLFEPFVTTKEDGSGLGLSISYGIIKDHHGRIHAHSTLGQGTTFTIELPTNSAG